MTRIIEERGLDGLREVSRRVIFVKVGTINCPECGELFGNGTDVWEDAYVCPCSPKTVFEWAEEDGA